MTEEMRNGIIIPHFPGMHIFHDIRNENYLLRDHPIVRSAEAPEEPFTPKTASLRAYYELPGGQEGSSCTGAGGTIGLCAAPYGYKKPPISYLERYELNRAEDKRNGRNYDEGATSVSVAEVMRQRGEITSYHWGYTMDTLLRCVAHPVKANRVGVFCGTGIYGSMFNADAEGIVRVKYNSGYYGGHFYFLGAFEQKRALIDIFQSWGRDRFNRWKQKIPADELYQLLRDDGEFFAITETPKIKIAA